MEAVNFKYRSSEINKIAKALSQAQGAYKDLKPNERSSHGEFANQKAIEEATRQALSQYKIACNQWTELEEDGSGKRILWTQLMHESGQWLTTSERIIWGTNERKNGSLLAIAKRRQLALILGIASSAKDPYMIDDDGEASEYEDMIDRAATPAEDAIHEEDREVITTKQYKELMIELDKMPHLVQSICHKYRIDTVADLPLAKFDKVKAEIYRIKKVITQEK